MPRMICVRCQRDLIPRKNGVLFIDMAYDPPIPMASASADLFQCPSCGMQIVTGFSTFEHDSKNSHVKILTAEIRSQPVFRSFENNVMKEKWDAQNKETSEK